MPLNIAALTGTPGLPGAGERDYPPTTAALASEWSAAITAWASAIVPPSAAVTAAGEAFEVSLLAAFNNPDQAARLPLVTTAFTTWAVTVGGGMAPAFVAVPPPAPVPWAAAFAGGNLPTRVAGVAAVASTLDAWARTGTATPSGGGPPVPWS